MEPEPPEEPMEPELSEPIEPEPPEDDDVTGWELDSPLMVFASR